jgi:hypothetical protein
MFSNLGVLKSIIGAIVPRHQHTVLAVLSDNSTSLLG